MQNVYRLSDFSPARGKTAVAPPTDEDLVAAIAKGDRRSMQVLYARHSTRIHRFVLRRVGNAALAEDIVSEVFLAVWSRADRFERRSKATTWLLAIAHHKALNAMRRTAEATLDDATAGTIADSADDPETVLGKKRRGEIVRKCLDRLSTAQREIVDLVYYHNRSIAEVAGIVGIPEGTVKTRMFYARQHMAKMLQSAGVDGV